MSASTFSLTISRILNIAFFASKSELSKKLKRVCYSNVHIVKVLLLRFMIIILTGCGCVDNGGEIGWIGRGRRKLLPTTGLLPPGGC